MSVYIIKTEQSGSTMEQGRAHARELHKKCCPPREIARYLRKSGLSIYEVARVFHETLGFSPQGVARLLYESLDQGLEIVAIALHTELGLTPEELVMVFREPLREGPHMATQVMLKYLHIPVTRVAQALHSRQGGEYEWHTLVRSLRYAGVPEKHVQEVVLRVCGDGLTKECIEECPMKYSRWH